MAAVANTIPASKFDIKGKGRARDSRNYGQGSMQGRLAKWRESLVGSSTGQSLTAAQSIPREVLLRDAVLLLQGVNGQYARFQDSSPDIKRDHKGLPLHPLEQDYAEIPIQGQLLFVEPSNTARLPASTKELLNRIAEVGWLYRSVSQTIQGKLRDSQSGTTELALCHCLQEHLHSYDALVSTIETYRHVENELVHTDTALNGESSSSSRPLQSPNDLSQYEDETHLTLRKILTMVEESRLKLRLMAVIAESSQLNRGGALLSHIDAYTKHGDPFVSQFSSRLLAEVARPFFRFLAAWIHDGELRDPGQEFFIERRPASTQEDERRPTSWSDRYQMRNDMLPSFVEETFSHKIFSTGRSLNYLKYACADTTWVQAQQKLSLSPHNLKLEYSDIAGLKHSIDAAYQKASRRLFSVFFEKFKLLKHLKALKDYLLLGKGDFVECLIDHLGPSLSRPANTLYRHKLTTTLETAIQGSSSSADDDEVLGRLDARMLEYEHGEVGWDVFTLEYKVDPPVDVIIDGRSMELYSKLFSHLWRIKRVEYTLTESWKRIMNESRYHRRIVDFHKARASLAEMLHFVRQLQYFCHQEVIECSWAALSNFVDKGEGDLDALIEAHNSYINRLASKGLLRAVSRKGNAAEEDGIMTAVRDAFKQALKFAESLDALCNHALSEAARLDDRGSLQSPPATDSARNVAPDFMTAIRSQLRKSSTAFQDTVQGLVSTLAAHPDLDLRFLACRINFSLFYLVGKSRK